MGATIRDVAKKAGVSPATVSRYFSGSTVVGKELSKRIEEASNKLKYVPNHTTKPSQGVIIVLVPHLELGYFSEVMKEIMRQMPRYNCQIIFFPTIPGNDDYKYLLKELFVIGVVYLDENIDRDMINYIQAKNIRTLMLGGAAFDSRCDMVHINDMAAAYEGMKYLLQMEHRDILILTDYATSISSGFQRLMGCQQALEEYDIVLDKDEMVEYGHLYFEDGYRGIKNALKKQKKFTAVFAFSDETALGAISALHESGFRVPEDISVLGFDGISVSRHVVPKLTTIYQPIDKMVEWTLDNLCSKGKKKRTENIEYTLPYKILERETVRKREEKRDE